MLNHSLFYRVLIATIKDMGLCPCPRCVTPKSMFGSLGLAGDMRSRVNNLRAYIMTNVVQARDFIHRWGNTVDGVKVDNTLGEGSWVPVIVGEIAFLLFYNRSHHLLTESIRQEAWTFQFRPIPDARRRLYAQVRVGHLESAFHASHQASLRPSSRE